MVEQHRMDPEDLDALFHSAQRTQPLPDELFARIMADASDEAARRDDAVAPAGPAGLWAAILDTVGGWPSLAGLATAALAGVWIGVSQPMTLDSFGVDLVSGDSAAVYDLDDLMPGFAVLSEEG